MRSDPRHLLVLGGVSFLGLGLYHVEVLREVVVIAALVAVARFIVTPVKRVE